MIFGYLCIFCFDLMEYIRKRDIISYRAFDKLKYRWRIRTVELDSNIFEITEPLMFRDNNGTLQQS